jgi:hypothetical protein
MNSANLQGADLSGADFQDAYLEFASLQGAYLGGAHFERVDLSGTNLSHVRIAGAWLDKTRFTKEQLGGAIGEELAREYGAAKQGYLALKQNFDDLGDYDAAGWAYCNERHMEKIEAWRQGREALKEHRWWSALSYSAKVASDEVVELLCNYGESVRRVVGWMVVTLFVIAPALIWLSGGLVWPQSEFETYQKLPLLLDKMAYVARQDVLYMLDIFTTTNYSALEPATDWGKLISGCMALWGIFLAGLLGFVAGNRIRRS